MHYNPLADTRSVYIHWPFCPYKCHFCPFVAMANQDPLMGRYHEVLKTEMRKFAQSCGRKLELDTVYFGGGTPSTYPDDLLLDTFDTMESMFTFLPSTEVTVEVNPGTVRIEQLALWKKIGINRLSIGVQSLNDKALKKLNRLQSAQDVLFVLEHASKLFENISVDLILGLPGVSVEDWKKTLQTAVNWPIKHVSMYFLEVHEKTPLYFGVKANKVALPCDEEVVDLYYWSRDVLAQHGFEQYEVSSFARKGFRSKHNSAYWKRNPFKGFGIGACSFDGTTRTKNGKYIKKYMDAIEAGEHEPVLANELTREQIFLEKIMLGIRKVEGIDIKDASVNLSEREKQRLQERITHLQKSGCVIQEDGRVVLTPYGLSLENEVATQLSLT